MYVTVYILLLYFLLANIIIDTGVINEWRNCSMKLHDRPAWEKIPQWTSLRFINGTLYALLSFYCDLTLFNVIVGSRHIVQVVVIL